MKNTYPKFRPFPINKRIPVRCISCYDGDTCTIVANLLGDKKLNKYTFSCRLYGIDSPEKRPTNNEQTGEQEKLASHYDKLLLESLILDKDNITMEVQEEEDKYGRQLVIFYNEEELNVNEELIKKGNSVSYTGGGKISWSDRIKQKEMKYI